MSDDYNSFQNKILRRILVAIDANEYNGDTLTICINEAIKLELKKFAKINNFNVYENKCEYILPF